MSTSAEINASQILAQINQLQLKAFQANNVRELSFIIVNDTREIIPYDRAILWECIDNKYQIANISGQVTLSKTSDLILTLNQLVSEIKDPATPQLLTNESFSEGNKEWNKFREQFPKHLIFWHPIKDKDGKVVMALWLEGWEALPWKVEHLNMLHFLGEGFATSYEKFKSKITLKKNLKKFLPWAFLTLFLLSFIIRVPLRIVAPCEVIPKDPIVITTPLEGEIEEIKVKHGQLVDQGDVLFTYDKKLPGHSTAVAQKELDIAQQDYERAHNLGFEEAKSQNEMEILRQKALKEKIKLEFIKKQDLLLDVKAPLGGTIDIEKPDDWRGKKVGIGEKVMIIYDKNNTKIQIFIPENDKIPLDKERKVKIFLNNSPEKSYEANLTYISSYTTVSNTNIVNFIAEAEWVNIENDIQPGLKGTAVLYGEKVSLIYWLLRKPFNTFREFTGY